MDIQENGSFFEGYSCYGDQNIKYKYELDWKEYYNPPKLVFEGNFLKKKVGKHINWNYKGFHGIRK